jgi:hypothetical protein
MNNIAKAKESKSFILILALTLLVYSILRGIKFPNIWSYTHYLFNYENGFTKRGLIGSIVRKIDIEFMYSYHFFFIFSIATFALSIALFIRLIKKSLKPGDVYFELCIYLFMSSLALVFLSNTIGYFDHIGLLITLIILNISSFKYKLLFAFPSFIFCLFTHEASAIIFFPVVFLSLLNEIPPKKNIKKYLSLIAFSITCIVVTFVVGGSTISENKILSSVEKAQHLTVTKLRPGAFGVQQHGGYTDRLKKKQSSLKYKKSLLKSISKTGPTALIFSAITIIYLIQINASFFLISLATLAAFSPLLLHYFAWDMHRFNTLTITTSFLVLLIFTSTNICLIKKIKKGHVFITACFILGILFNLNMKIPLLNGSVVNEIPFIEHYCYLKDVFHGNASFPDIPN